MTYALYIYFAINLFSAGYYCCEQMTWASTPYEKVKLVVNVVLCILFGCIIGIVTFAWGTGQILWDWITEQTQINFLFSFYFTNKYSNLDAEALKRGNDYANLFTGNSLRHRSMRYCQRLINKRYKTT